MSDIERRIKGLERSNARLRAALWGVALLLFAIGAGKGPTDELVTRRLLVVDSLGNVQAEIKAERFQDPSGGQIYGGGSLNIYNASNRAAVIVTCAKDDGYGFISVNDSSGTGRVSLWGQDWDGGPGGLKLLGADRTISVPVMKRGH